MSTEKNNKKVVVTKIEKPLIKLNALFNDVLDKISFNNYSNDTKRQKEIKKLSNQVDDVIFQEIKKLTDFTGDDISTFLVKLFNDYDTQQFSDIKKIEDIFSSEDNAIFQFFNERYRNQNLLYEDLDLICSHLFELEEAVNATRDAIVTADDVTQSISRNLQFKSANCSEEDRLSYISLIENLETKFKLSSKLKNHIIPKTLQYGKYFVYTVPYAKLFENFYDKKVRELKSISITESIDDDFISELKTDSGTKIGSKVLKQEMTNLVKDIEIDNNVVHIPILEGVDVSELITDEKFKKDVEEVIKNANKSKNKNNSFSTLFTDATISTDKNNNFDNITDCFIKLISPKKIIPVKIMDHVIGYYYIHESSPISKSPFINTIRINTVNLNSPELENMFLTKLTEKIVKSFNKKYLEENIKFKELIFNCLSYNELYKKKIKFQFIPVDYITEFTVNENEEGDGTSILIKSLFYAKLYLALLIFKMVSIISKSNDTRINYIKNSGIDTNIINKLQDVARALKERDINFMDLLNYNTMVSKIGHAKSLFVPVGRTGEKGMEFDVLAGQDIQLNTDLMEMLKTSYINGTGVPSVIMNYINEADNY